MSEETLEFDLVNNPHEHALRLYREGKLVSDIDDGRDGCCTRCHEPWRPPMFSCSDCNFQLHESCIHFPPEIHTPFHPQHPLSFTEGPSHCNCCFQWPFGKLYKCVQCPFAIDLQCVIVDRKSSVWRIPGQGGQFRHFAHPHPLTLQQQQHPNPKVDCLVCQLLITSAPCYSCSRTDSYFHQRCAELPRELLPNLGYHDHHHPLFLFPAPSFRDESRTFCNSCGSQCTKFFCSCPPCNFHLHVACLLSFNHQHDFTKFPKLFPYECHLCRNPGDGDFPWYCSICHHFAHKKCAIPKMSKHEDHHLHPSTQPSHDSDIGSLVKGESGFRHFSHEHELTQLCTHKDKEDKLCDGCMRLIPTQSQSYGCSDQYDFHLHEQCARLPIQYQNSSLHPHELSMVYIPNFVFSCAVCLQFCHGFAYHCAKCGYAIDIRCAAAFTISFSHSSHSHPLTHYNAIKETYRCEACGEDLRFKEAFGCHGCNFYLDARCTHLPLAIRNRFDEHPLILTLVNIPTAEGKSFYEDVLEALDDNENEEYEDNDEYCSSRREILDKNFYRLFKGFWNESDEYEYYCDICEEGRREDEAFYCCRLCCFAAHPRCVIGEYPFLKSAKCEELAHQHPLSVVKEGKKDCGACGKSCEGELAFECGRCKFNVHAFGLCYHQQLTQGRISFIMPSLRDRSIPLFLDPNEIKLLKLFSVLGVKAEMGSLSRNARWFIDCLPRLEDAYFMFKKETNPSIVY